ncbi:MAG: hypothetical protein IKX24_09330, partial [Prevotella sp.]|nr:hypothetical protein [Prevotella sp.]
CQSQTRGLGLLTNKCPFLNRFLQIVEARFLAFGGIGRNFAKGNPKGMMPKAVRRRLAETGGWTYVTF